MCRHARPDKCLPVGGHVIKKKNRIPCLTVKATRTRFPRSNRENLLAVRLLFTRLSDVIGASLWMRANARHVVLRHTARLSAQVVAPALRCHLQNGGRGVASRHAGQGKVAAGKAAAEERASGQGNSVVATCKLSESLHLATTLLR